MKRQVRQQYLQDVKHDIQFTETIIKEYKQTYKETKDEWVQQRLITYKEELKKLKRKYLSLQKRFAKQ